MLTIPVNPNAVHQDLSVELDGKPYRLQIRYNQRADRYALNVLTGDGVELMMGAVIVPNRDFLLRVYHNPAHPGGILSCLANPGNNDMPRFGDLGARCQLVYWTKADVLGVL